MQRVVCFDAGNDRLVYYSEAPTDAYWDGLWAAGATEGNVSRGDRFVTAETRRWLPSGARVIDAGCGIAATVFGLDRAGFDAYGVDNAARTVETVVGHFPSLKIQVADVRRLPFPDEWFDGLWSLGVIEHFYDGYDAVIREARRVLRPGGLLFLTVPAISPLRRLRILAGGYPEYSEAIGSNKFFQFAFSTTAVVSHVTAQGFVLRGSFGRSGSYGLSEELPTLAKVILPARTNSMLLARAWWRALDWLLTPLTYHVRYFRFQKVS